MTPTTRGKQAGWRTRVNAVSRRKAVAEGQHLQGFATQSPSMIEIGGCCANARSGTAICGLVERTLRQIYAFSHRRQHMASLLGRRIEDLDASIKELDAKLAAAHKANEVSTRLATIPGVGPVTALTLAIEIDPEAFESGRHLAAWAGLTPKEHSTGGKQRMGGISRAGNERMRSLLVAGAMSVIRVAVRPESRQMTDWLWALLTRKPRKLVAVALANKMARMAWALMTRGEVYRRSLASTAAA